MDSDSSPWTVDEIVVAIIVVGFIVLDVLGEFEW